MTLRRRKKIPNERHNEHHQACEVIRLRQDELAQKLEVFRSTVRQDSKKLRKPKAV